MCIFSSCGCKNRTFSSDGGHNYDILKQCISDVYASRNMGLYQNKNCQNICFCPSKLIGIHGKLNKSNFVVFSAIFLFQGVFPQ